MFEDLRPIPLAELEVQPLRAERIWHLARIVMRKERPTMTVMRANQPQHQFGIMRRDQMRIGHGPCHRLRLVPPVIGQARLPARGGDIGAGQFQSGFREWLARAQRRQQTVPAEKHCLETRIFLARIVQPSGQDDIGGAIRRNPCGGGEGTRLRHHGRAMNSEHDGLCGDGAGGIILGDRFPAIPARAEQHRARIALGA